MSSDQANPSAGRPLSAGAIALMLMLCLTWGFNQIAVKLVLPVTNADFTYGAQSYWRPWDAWYSVIKSFFFAGSITIISCYMGFSTQQGAEGVGRSTTGAVVSSSVLILLLDVVLPCVRIKAEIVAAGTPVIVWAHSGVFRTPSLSPRRYERHDEPGGALGGRGS